MDPPELDVLAAIERGPIDIGDALRRDDLDRLADPAPLPAETGWCTLPDGVGYVAVRTAMPGVTGGDGRLVVRLAPGRRPALPHLAPAGALRELGRAPHARGRQDPLGDRPSPGRGRGRRQGPRADRVRRAQRAGHVERRTWTIPRVATIVCGWAGDDGRRVRHTPMAHVFLDEPGGVVLRSRFWLGAAMRPYLPGPLAAPLAVVLNTGFVRRRTLPDGAPRALARHCAEEYANLGALLPELYSRFGPAA